MEKVWNVKLQTFHLPSINRSIEQYDMWCFSNVWIQLLFFIFAGHNVFASIADYLTACQSLELEKLDEKLSSLVLVKRAEKQMFKDWLECLQVGPANGNKMFAYAKCLCSLMYLFDEKSSLIFVSFFFYLKLNQISIVFLSFLVEIGVAAAEIWPFHSDGSRPTPRFHLGHWRFRQ